MWKSWVENCAATSGVIDGRGGIPNTRAKMTLSAGSTIQLENKTEQLNTSHTVHSNVTQRTPATNLSNICLDVTGKCRM